MFTQVKGESPESLIFKGLISGADLDLQQDKELQEWIYQPGLHLTQSVDQPAHNSCTLSSAASCSPKLREC